MSQANARREVIFDTETTGIRPQDGHRVVEVGAVEYIDGVRTGKVLHYYLNPDRPIPAETTNIHGVTDEMVASAPRFRDILPEFLDFFRGAICVAHNSEFDERFLDSELKLAGHSESFWSIPASIVDTLRESRRVWPNERRHSLDAVLARTEVDASARTLHGALLDSELLGEAYVKIKALKALSGPTVFDDISPNQVVYMTDPPEVFTVFAPPKPSSPPKP